MRDPDMGQLYDRYHFLFYPLSKLYSKHLLSKEGTTQRFFSCDATIFYPQRRPVHARFVSEIIRIRICRNVNLSRPGRVQSFQPFLIRLKIIKTKRCKKFGCSRIHILGVSTRRLRFFFAYESSMDRALETEMNSGAMYKTRTAW